VPCWPTCSHGRFTMHWCTSMRNLARNTGGTGSQLLKFDQSLDSILIVTAWEGPKGFSVIHPSLIKQSNTHCRSVVKSAVLINLIIRRSRVRFRPKLLLKSCHHQWMLLSAQFPGPPCVGNGRPRLGSHTYKAVDRRASHNIVTAASVPMPPVTRSASI